MFAARKLRRQCFKTLSPLIVNNPSKNDLLSRDVPCPFKFVSSNVVQSSLPAKDVSLYAVKILNCFVGSRKMSTGKGTSIRSKVERRMQKESGRTIKEIRRAKSVRRKLMTPEERLIFNLRRAKKKVALLLQKLKKYELPELPTPRHDPELLTPEQLQAYKKIGFRNKNYVPVGVRGVFGGVVQNMHLHWKFHETVQVCCDNFPKEKIKEMATMLARLSGGIVINIHNVKTIIMFRGRNYRQPKNLIPINTLTKRKALFKARFEQALESQKLNIKKIEQELRRKGVNPDDPVATASMQRVASTFFSAIDKREGSPYVFREDKQPETEPQSNIQRSEAAEDSDQEELDRFIAEIEGAADQEWAAEEAAEKEELSKIRYWNQEDFGGRSRRSEILGSEDSDDDIRGARVWKEDVHSGRQMPFAPDYVNDNVSEDDEEWGSDDVEDESGNKSDGNNHARARSDTNVRRVERGKQNSVRRVNRIEVFKRNAEAKFRQNMSKQTSESENTLSNLDDAMWKSSGEEEEDFVQSKVVTYNYKSSTAEEEDYLHMNRDVKNGVDVVNHLESHASDTDESALDKINVSRAERGMQNKFCRANNTESFNANVGDNNRQKTTKEKYASDDLFSDLEIAMWESEAEGELDSETSRPETHSRRGDSEDKAYCRMEDGEDRDRDKFKTLKQVDETWDSD